MVLENGNVIGMGTHEELMETRPLYREIGGVADRRGTRKGGARMKGRKPCKRKTRKAQNEKKRRCCRAFCRI